MDIQMAPKISTLDLSMSDRIMGRVLKMEHVEGEFNQGQQDLAGDVFHSLFRGREQRSEVPNERIVNKTLLDWAKSTEAWQQVSQKTNGNVAASLLGGQMMFHTLTTDDAMQEALQKQQEAEQAQQAAEQAEREARMQNALDPTSPDAQQAQQRYQQAQQAADQAAQQAQAYTQQLAQNRFNQGVMAGAIKQADKEAQRVNALFGGWGHGPGSQLAQDAKQSIAFMKAHTPKVERIARLAGRMRGIGADARRQRVIQGTVPSGYTFTQDIRRIVVSELAMLSSQAHPLLRATKLGQYANGGLFGNNLETTLNEAGAFVFMADVSGSMSGEREEHAKGVGLGMAQIAKAEQRPYRLFSFSSGQDAVVRCASEESWEAHLKWAEMVIHGGTDFDMALETAIADLRLLGERGLNADLVMSSDGEAMVSAETVKLWQAFKTETGARLLYIPVAQGYGSIDQLADLVYPVEDLMSDDTAKAVATWMR
jgi:uncharacterized protein with von Willebrand factor type A (vWA) domain